MLQLLGVSQRSSVVEQLFRKQQVGSSILPVGSSTCAIGRRDTAELLSKQIFAFVGQEFPSLFGESVKVETDTCSTASGDHGIVIPIPPAQSENWSS